MSPLMKRHTGKIDFEITTLGLGGQAALQWPLTGEDSVRIISKAVGLGVNCFDTSNVYGPSQSNYGRAFRALHLLPGRPGYQEALRRSIFLVSKTMLRFAKGGWQKGGMRNKSDGRPGSRAVFDLKRSLSQIFGDGQGCYPRGSYLDLFLVHAVESEADVEAVYAGYDHPDPRDEDIGALAMMVDYRDGTNLTGLNPREEKLVRHIGFSGHASPAVMMDMIQRDHRGVLDGVLVAINANDRLYFNMQHNLIPVAAARRMGVIGMKVFADGAMYAKDAVWTSRPDMVVREVGGDGPSSRSLIEYSLATPGVHCVVIGIGHIDEDPVACQLQQNLAASQLSSDAFDIDSRHRLERLVGMVKGGKTNYFQAPARPLSAVRNLSIDQSARGRGRLIRLEWQTAYAGDEPVVFYEIWRDLQKVGRVNHLPQTDRIPFGFEEILCDQAVHHYQVVTVDAAGREARSEDVSAGV